MKKDECKILQFSPKSNRKIRFKRKNFNYFAPLFFISLSFNILLLFAILIK